MTRALKHKPILVPLTRTQIKILWELSKKKLAVDSLSVGHLPDGNERRSLMAARETLAGVYFGKRDEVSS